MDPHKTGFTEQDIRAIEKVLERIDSRCIWCKLTRHEFTLHRFETGLVNDVSRCKLKPDARKRLCRTPADYPEIVVKFFTMNPRFPCSPVQRAIINTIASASDLSPRLIFIDESVMVQQCITNGRTPDHDDDYDDAFFEQTARKIARFHCMPAPVSTSYDEWNRFLEACKTDFAGSSRILDGSFREALQADPLLEKGSLSCLCRLNFDNLFKYFFGAGIEAVNSPRAFIHLDFNRDNRIVEETIDPASGAISKKLFFIDLDFAMFHYRAIDLGVYFECYGQREFRFGEGSLPDEGRMIEFAEIYRHECSNILGNSFKDDPQNATDKIVVETKVFVLYAYFISMWITLNAYFDSSFAPSKRQKFIQGCITRARQFVDYHAILVQQQVLPDIGVDFFY